MYDGESWDNIIANHGEPLLRFKPSGHFTEKEKMFHDIPKECAVFDISKNHSSAVLIFTRYRDKWHVNYGERWIIRELLIQKGVLNIDKNDK